MADPEGPLPGAGGGGGGVTKSALRAAGEGAGGGYPVPQVGSGGFPSKILEKLMQMVHSEPILAKYVFIIPRKLCVMFAFKAPIYVMRDNFHLCFRGTY